MAEEDIEINENEDILSGLENGDIKPTIYEGGFKTWECAVDLAKVLAGEGASKMTGLDEEYYDLHIIEVCPSDRALSQIQSNDSNLQLGAGTGIPSLALFRNILHNASAVHLQPQPHRRRQFHFTFGDYNQSVLRLATLPNILLAWSSFKGLTSPEANGTGDLEVTPDLLREFTVDLECFGVRIDFISGAWGEGFVDCAVAHDPTSHTGGESSKTLVLASESIYAPSSLQRFTHTLLLLLLAARSQGGDALALVAAKRVYFGVGGGVDEFRALITTLGATVEQMVEVKDGGVGRVVLQIRFDVPVLSS